VISVSGVAAPSLSTPWELQTAWPNPSEGDTHFVYRVPRSGGWHALDVYDAAGRSIRRLFSGTRPAGDYEMEWDGRDARGARVASGVYFVRVSPNGATPVARKLVLLH
jgi:flagellar hook assembly protein FlgD